MSETTENRPIRHVSAYTRLFRGAAVGIISSLFVGALISWTYALLTFWNVTALVILIDLWRSLYHLTPSQTEAHATNEDPGRGGAQLMLVGTSIASLAAVVLLLAQKSGIPESAKILHVGLGIASIVTSWAVVHAIYALRYADMYFKHPGSIDFNNDSLPSYRDFVYLAFTIGMTYQVADTNLRTTHLRSTVLRHALLSYLFGTAIIATTINLIVNLG